MWQCGAPQQNTGLAAADPEQKDPRHRVPQTPSARVRAGNIFSLTSENYRKFKFFTNTHFIIRFLLTANHLKM